MLFTSHCIGVIDANKTAIVDTHNSYRAGVNPTAVLMYKMVRIFLTDILNIVWLISVIQKNPFWKYKFWFLYLFSGQEYNIQTDILMQLIYNLV